MVKTDEGQICVASIYLDIQKQSAREEGLIKLSNFCRKVNLLIITGIDTNAHASMWGSMDDNKRGKNYQHSVLTLPVSQLSTVNYLEPLLALPTYCHCQEKSLGMTSTIVPFPYQMFFMALPAKIPIDTKTNSSQFTWIGYGSRHFNFKLIKFKNVKLNEILLINIKICNDKYYIIKR